MRPILIIAALIAAPLLAAGAARAEDRYGPTPDRAAQYIPTSMLAWPGKQASPTAVPAPTPTPTPRLAPVSTSTLPTSIYAPPPPADTPRPSPLRSMGATTATASVQPMVAPGEGAPPRFYSVAREYGVKPDPIALTPQFLADTGSADLAEPPPLPPPHLSAAQTANMSTAAATNQTRAANEASEASDATALN